MMVRFRLHACAPLTGLAAMVLLITSVVMIGAGGYLASPAEILAAATDPGQVAVGAYLGGMAVFLLVWFSGTLYGSLRTADGMAPVTALIQFGGGVLVAASLALVLAAATATVDRAGAEGGIEVADAVALYDLRAGLLGEAMPAGLALMVGSVGVASAGGRVFPSWFGWLSIVIALVSLSPFGFLGQTAAVLWVAIVSVWLTVRGATTVPGRSGSRGL